MKRIVSIAAVLFGATIASADARPVPTSQWDTGTQLTLAQVMVGEADWHEPDHIAIAYVLTRRWHHYQHAKGPITFQRYMQLYSSTMKVDTERARWVRALPWGKLEGPHQERWSKVIELVKAWGAGKVENPCPEAEHWGGGMDRPGRKWMPVSCGMTKNIFYGSREKSFASRPSRMTKAKESDDASEVSPEQRAKAPQKAATKSGEARAPAQKRAPATSQTPRGRTTEGEKRDMGAAPTARATREAPESKRSHFAMARPGDW